jgi:hypothetical protein
MGKDSSTEPMRKGIWVSWHGAATTTGDDRRMRALRQEHGHRMVTSSVVDGVGPSDWGMRLNPFWAADWWARPG